MKIDKINNLLELFYNNIKYKIRKIFFYNLKRVKKIFWEDVYLNINKLSEEISKHIKKGDRCLLVSENRPEWMISDLSIMLSGE